METTTDTLTEADAEVLEALGFELLEHHTDEGRFAVGGIGKWAWEVGDEIDAALIGILTDMAHNKGCNISFVAAHRHGKPEEAVFVSDNNFVFIYGDATYRQRFDALVSVLTEGQT